MSWLVDGVVVETKAGWEPTLFHLWVKGRSAVEIGINASEDCSIYLVVMSLKSVMEHHLQVRVVGVVDIEVFWRGGSVEADVFKCKSS